MSKLKITILTITIASVMLLGCGTNSSFTKKDIGTYAGAIIGGLFGSKVGDGTGRAIAIALGTAAGAYLGNQFGSWLDERDQQDVATIGGGALENAQDGQTVTWSNPETQLDVSVTPTNTRTMSRDIKVVRLKTVEKRDLQIIGQPYAATKSSNLRAGPSTSSSVVGGLRTGESFEAIGRVVDVKHNGHGWLAVGKGGGRLVGYVWEPLAVHQMSESAQSQGVLATSAEIQELNKAKLSEPVDLDALDVRVSEKAGGQDLDKLFEEDTIAVNTQCRDMNMSVEKGEHDGDSSFSACKTPNGAWEII